MENLGILLKAEVSGFIHNINTDVMM